MAGLQIPKYLRGQEARTWMSIIGWAITLGGLFSIFTQEISGRDFYITAGVTFLGIILIGGLPTLKNFIKNIKKISVVYFLFIVLLIGIGLRTVGPGFLLQDTYSFLISTLVVSSILAPLILAFIKNK